MAVDTPRSNSWANTVYSPKPYAAHGLFMLENDDNCYVKLQYTISHGVVYVERSLWIDNPDPMAYMQFFKPKSEISPRILGLLMNVTI